MLWPWPAAWPSFCSSVDVVLLDGDCDLSQEVVCRAVGGEDQVGFVQPVRLLGLDVPLRFCFVKEACESRLVTLSGEYGGVYAQVPAEESVDVRGDMGLVVGPSDSADVASS